MCVYKQLKQEQSLIRKKNGISSLDFALHSLARERHLKKMPVNILLKAVLQSYMSLKKLIIKTTDKQWTGLKNFTLQSVKWWLGCKTNNILTFSVCTCFSSFPTDCTKDGHSDTSCQALHKVMLSFQKIIGSLQ